MDNQQFYNPKSNNAAPQFRNPQFHSFNPKPKPASEIEKRLSLDTKPTQTPDGFGACEESHAKKTVSPAESTHLHDSVHVETPEFPFTESHHIERDYSGNHSPIGNASDKDSGSEDDLRSLFSQLGDDFSDTGSYPDCKPPDGIRKPYNDGVVEDSRTLGTGDSKDTPIVIDDESMMTMVPECEQEERQSHGGGMPLSIASLGHSDGGGGAGSCDDVNSGTAKHSPSGKRKRDSKSEIGSPNTEGRRLLAVFSSHDGSDQTQPPGTETYRSAGRHSDETQSDVV